MTVMWLVRLLIRWRRRWARGRTRLSVGPSSTQARLTTSEPASTARTCPALAMALASTLPTGSLADCGAKRSAACACSASNPRIRSTTRRALRGVTRTYRAFALASIALSLSRSLSFYFAAAAPYRVVPLTTAAPVVAHVAAEGPGRRELAELVPDHRLGDEHGHVLAAVVHGDRVAQHRGNDHGATGPCLDDVLGALVVLHVHLLYQVVVNERALLQATRHFWVLLPLLLAAPTGNHRVAGLVGPPGAPLGLPPRADRVAAARALALAAAQPVVDRVHRDPPDRWATPLPPAPARLAELDVALLGIADLADRRPAGGVHAPDLARGHAQLRELALLGQQLHAGPRRARDLGSAAGPQLDGVHHGAGRDVAQRHAGARLHVRARAVLDQVTLAQALGGDDVALLPVGVVQQRDPGGPVRVGLA